jgi:hypothetical protein
LYNCSAYQLFSLSVDKFYMEGGEGRPAVPVLRPQGERNGNGSQQNKNIIPFPLGGDLRALVQEARANWRGDNPKFDAAYWMRNKFKVTFSQTKPQTYGEETLTIMKDVMSAYEILAYPHFLYDDYRRDVGLSLSAFAEGGVTLDARGLPMLEAMAEATDVPFTPGQTRFELPTEVIEQHIPLGYHPDLFTVVDAE